ASRSSPPADHPDHRRDRRWKGDRAEHLAAGSIGSDRLDFEAVAQKDAAPTVSRTAGATNGGGKALDAGESTPMSFEVGRARQAASILADRASARAPQAIGAGSRIDSRPRRAAPLRMGGHGAPPP